MVVPVSGTPNLFPVERGKKLPGRGEEQVSFEDYLVEKAEAPEEGHNRGGGRRKNRNGFYHGADQPQQPGPERNDSQGGGIENDKPDPGRRIDLMA
ncbi:MAG: hypothetical protein V1794_04245 [Candidatus Glassbacteria bacterium]